MQAVTIERFQNVLRELIAKEKDSQVILVEDIEDEPDLKLLTVYTVKDGKPSEKETELPRDQVEDWLRKKGSPTYLLVEETPFYLAPLSKDHFGTKEFQKLAERLGIITAMCEARDEAVELLDDMVAMFRAIEDASYRLADFYIDDVPKV